MIKTLTTDELEKFLAILAAESASDKKNLRAHMLYFLALLMCDAGLRLHEALNLTSEYIFFNGEPVKSITVPKEIAKNKKERVIPATTRLQNAIRRLPLPKTPATVCYWCSYTPRHIQRIFSKAGRIATGRRITPHMLRHTFADRLRKVTDIRTLQELLGHSSLSSTQIYLHPNGEDRELAIKALESKSLQK